MKTKFCLVLLLAAFAMVRCSKDPAVPGLADDGHAHVHLSPGAEGFPDIIVPSDNRTTLEGVTLGRKLFYDTKLSDNQTVSCASCHQQEFGFADGGKAFSVGSQGQLGARNAPTLTNAGWLLHTFWDGRTGPLEEQAGKPVLDPLEMNGNWSTIVSRIEQDQDYPGLFALAYPDEPISAETISKALAQFQRTLISDNSKFDRFLKDPSVYNDEELIGFNIFFSEEGECFHCHGGALFTDNEFHNIGLDFNGSDPGRATVTGNSNDHAKFKTPTLRNVAVTGPYMHDGRFSSLEAVVNFYSDEVKNSSNVSSLIVGAHNGGANFNASEKQALVAFLNTLTDEAFLNNPDHADPN